MSKYEAIISKHWRTYLPDAWSQLSDPEEMVRQAARSMEEQITQLAESTAGPDRPGETYFEKVSRLMSARSDAESDLIRELLPPPEEHLEAMDEEELLREMAWLADRRQAKLEQLRTQAEATVYQREDLTEAQQPAEIERELAFLIEQDALLQAHEETLSRSRS